MRLTYSQIESYSTCPRQYRLRYIDGWRPIRRPANLEFGTAIHAAVEAHLVNQADPVQAFADAWGKWKEQDLQYNSRESWESLNEIGRAMMEAWIPESRRIVAVRAMELPVQFGINSFDEWYGRLDLVADVADDDGQIAPTLLDFKTASRAYDETNVVLSDQLTAYWFALQHIPDPPQRVAYVVFVKTKTPQIQWLFAPRLEADAHEYLDKIRWVAEAVHRGQFHRHPGMHCQWCDFRPICMGDEAAIWEQLTCERKESA